MCVWGGGAWTVNQSNRTWNYCPINIRIVHSFVSQRFSFDCKLFQVVPQWSNYISHLSLVWCLKKTPWCEFFDPPQPHVFWWHSQSHTVFFPLVRQYVQWHGINVRTGSGFVVVFRVGYLIAVVMGLLAMMLPRSPSWLARKGANDAEILESLQFIRPSATLESVGDLRKSIEASNSDKLKWESKLRKMAEDPRWERHTLWYDTLFWWFVPFRCHTPLTHLPVARPRNMLSSHTSAWLNRYLFPAYL